MKWLVVSLFILFVWSTLNVKGQVCLPEPECSSIISTPFEPTETPQPPTPLPTLTPTNTPTNTPRPRPTFQLTPVRLGSNAHLPIIFK